MSLAPNARRVNRALWGVTMLSPPCTRFNASSCSRWRFFKKFFDSLPLSRICARRCQSRSLSWAPGFIGAL